MGFGQEGADPGSAACRVTADGADGTTEQGGDLVVTLAFEMPEYQDRALMRAEFEQRPLQLIPVDNADGWVGTGLDLGQHLGRDLGIATPAPPVQVTVGQHPADVGIRLLDGADSRPVSVSLEQYRLNKILGPMGVAGERIGIALPGPPASFDVRREVGIPTSVHTLINVAGPPDVEGVAGRKPARSRPAPGAPSPRAKTRNQ